MQNALILAGGKSSRMGVDKTLLKCGEFTSFTHFLFAKLSREFTQVLVSAKSQKFLPPLPLLQDDFTEFCPLFVIANLDKFFTNAVFIATADAPFIKINMIKTLFNALENHEICVASSIGQIHFLCGFFTPSCAVTARKLIMRGEKSVKSLFAVSNAKIVDFQDNEQFLNLNSPQDLEKIDEKNFVL